MNYRLANECEIEVISDIVKAAIEEMEKNKIFQWDDVYPTKDDFLNDIKKRQLFVGILDGDISVVYTISREYDEEYNNGCEKVGIAEWRKGTFFLMEKHL